MVGIGINVAIAGGGVVLSAIAGTVASIWTASSIADKAKEEADKKMVMLIEESRKALLDKDRLLTEQQQVMERFLVKADNKIAAQQAQIDQLMVLASRTATKSKRSEETQPAAA